MNIKFAYIIFVIVLLVACSSQKNQQQESIIKEGEVDMDNSSVIFEADSAYKYIEQQVNFGPRVPNTEAHRQCAKWLASELTRHGAIVHEQHAILKAFDGTKLNATNIIGQFNPEVENRLLLMAHWDCRPWADADPNPQNHTKPVDGANDGASGVGVLLELARLIGLSQTDKGIDILFLDAEDWGTEGDDESWALGARYFVNNPFKTGYFPTEAILLDMVGGHNAIFRRELFSEHYAPTLVDKIWAVAEQSGYSNTFSNETGGAITDDHIEFIKAGIPAIDIIEYNPYTETGFNPTWHTVSDNMSAIDRTSLKAVGQTVINYIFTQK